MSRFDHVNKVLSEVARDLGVQDAALGEDDCATLAFDEMEVDFIYRAEPVELLWLYADLGEIPAEGDAAPALLLQAGFGSWALCRMTIGLDDERRRARSSAISRDIGRACCAPWQTPPGGVRRDTQRRTESGSHGLPCCAG
jgi:hypothetical protein